MVPILLEERFTLTVEAEEEFRSETSTFIKKKTGRRYWKAVFSACFFVEILKKLTER